MASKILLIDDDPDIRMPVRMFLEGKGMEVVEAGSCEAARAAVQDARFDVVLLDYLLPDGDALELMAKLRQQDSELPVIILTAHGSIELAVRAIKEGAEQFLTKPVQLPALWVLIERTLENRRSRRREAAVSSDRSRGKPDPFLGTSPAIAQLRERALRVVEAGRPVLIRGETGTGKGVLARWMHEQGSRRDEPYLELNCAALQRELLESELFGHEKGAFTGAIQTKKGLLEVAHQGTLLLDEIGDIDVAIQPKLLKVLEDMRFRRVGGLRDQLVDVHLVAATHQDLMAKVDSGEFRADLYYRIASIPLHVPALRERPEDIGPIAEELLQRLASELGRGEVPQLSPRALGRLRSYGWPGNVRELRIVLERALLLGGGDRIEVEDLDFDHLPGTSLQSHQQTSQRLEDVEREHMMAVLRTNQGKVREAAQELDIPRSTLYQKLKKYEIDPSQF
jgi:DNA-binding NtrC family response regulator